MRSSLVAVGAAALMLASAHAQNMAGVPGPVVRKGTNYTEYRIGYAVRDGGDLMAQRVHHDWAPTDRLMWRGIVQYRERRAGRSQEFDSVKAELFHELRGNRHRWRTGLRYDFTLREEDRPSTAGLLWLNEFQLTDKLSARADVVAGYDIGTARREGVLLSSRYSLTYRGLEGVGLSMEVYNRHGSTEELNLIEDGMQLGPAVSWTALGSWRFVTSVVTSPNSDTPRTDLRFWVGYNF